MSEGALEKEHIALILAIVALTLAASAHSSVALVIAIIALVLAFSDYKEVALGLGVIALILAVLGQGILHIPYN